jgi:hypothetical protein
MEMSICVPAHNSIIDRCLWKRHLHHDALSYCGYPDLVLYLIVPYEQLSDLAVYKKTAGLLVIIQNIKWVSHAGWWYLLHCPVFVSLHVNVQHYQLIPVLSPQPWILLFWSLTCGCPQTSKIWLVHTTSKTCHSKVNNIYHCSRNVSRIKSWCF